jgi:hypothetical protein
MIEELNRGPVQNERSAAPRCVKRALIPYRVRRAEKVQSTVVREDGIGSYCERHEKGIWTELGSRHAGRHYGIRTLGYQFKPAGFEVVF